MKKILFLILALIVILPGCTAPQSTKQYRAEFPYDPMQYMLFLKKEIQVVENQLNTVMSHIVLVTRDSYSAEQAAETADNSLRIIMATRINIDEMRPPATYMETREFAIDILARIEASLEELIRELSSSDLNEERLLEIKNSLHGDSISLSSLAVASWI